MKKEAPKTGEKPAAKKYLIVIACLTFLGLGFQSPKTGDLKAMLASAGNYCERMKDIALYYYVGDRIINFLRSASPSPIDRAFTLFSVAGDDQRLRPSALAKGGKADEGRPMLG